VKDRLFACIHDGQSAEAGRRNLTAI
jgi:hypothetical protein